MLIVTVGELRERVRLIMRAGLREALILPLHYIQGDLPTLRWAHPKTFTIEYRARGKKEEFVTEDPEIALKTYRKFLQ